MAAPALATALPIDRVVNRAALLSTKRASPSGRPRLQPARNRRGDSCRRSARRGGPDAAAVAVRRSRSDRDEH